jgi:DNA gyrase subunit A
VIAINFRDEDDELIGAGLVVVDDLLLVSKKGQAARFPPTTPSCGRWAGRRPA